ncbi:SurA N-terminal domain-containing protein [Comamonas composti]|uniref:SurA N-terminal domain-containing protein n=1 Tax=Comamonas composti TaxID=408558 RepID=UPI0004275E71|nr:SurA N-terminal domain-containing protein [Comamonas composti]
MFESIRKHSKFVMILLFLLIIPSFIFVGVNQNYFTESSATVARVDGHDIKQSDWDNAHRMEADRLRAENPSMDPKFLDSPEARYATLEKMVREQVLLRAVQKLHLTASDAELVQTLQDIPAIASLKNADGSLDAKAYAALLGSQGMTPEGFEANLRRELSLNKVLGTVSDTAFATNARVKQTIDALYQHREVQVQRFDAKSYQSKVQPSEAELKAYYEGHSSQFQQPEEADVEYLMLDLASVAAGITVSEDDLRTYYQQNEQRLAGPEERRVSHILVKVAQDAPEAEVDQAKAKAEELLAQVRKDPKGFAELAKTQSDDKGSAAAGGDLGFFGHGAMVKPFEDAVYAMSKGSVSDLVRTDFGFHIIELTDIKKPAAPSFESMRTELEAQRRQELAQAKFAEMAEAFTNTVYEKPESLAPAAEQFKLKLQKAEHVARQPQATAQAPLNNPRFLEALFSSEVLENKSNTNAVELAPGLLVAGRVSEYRPARTLAMNEVETKLSQLYTQAKSAELAKAEGQDKLKAWEAQPDTAKLGPAQVLGRDKTENLPQPLIDAVLRAPTNSWPQWVGVDLGNAGYAVVKVLGIAERAAQDTQTVQMQTQQFAQMSGMAETMAYYELLKKQFKVQIKVAHP